ncbi:MAG: magnesium transporter [Nitrososphaerota archaeon]
MVLLCLAHSSGGIRAVTSVVNSRLFFKTFREAVVAFMFDFGGIIAGFIVASNLNVFHYASWAFAIYPAVISAKGVIGGLFSGRLSTTLHIGTIHPRLFGNTKTFHKLYEAIILLTLVTSVAMCAVSMVFGSLIWGITLEDFLNILVVVLATMTLGLTISFLAIPISFMTFKRGLDPDVLVYPIMSTVADIGITSCYAIVLSLFFLFGDVGRYAVGFTGLFLVFLTLFILPRNIHDEDFAKTVRESLLTLVFVAFIVNITGTIMKSISAVAENRREIYTVYPALIGLIGDVGSVIGSTATTKLALGLLKPSFTAIKSHATPILAAWAASIAMFILASCISLVMNCVFELHVLFSFTSVLLATNVMAVSAIVLVSYTISILTFRRGLDPDNFVIPIESSFADSTTSVALLIVLLLTG